MMNLDSVLNQSAASRMMFNQTGNQTGAQQTLVGLPGPSPTAINNPSLSPFGQPLSQGSVTSTVSGPFATNNGPTLSSTSPASSQQQQFNDVMKRLAPSPSSFGLQQSSVPPQTQVHFFSLVIVFVTVIENRITLLHNNIMKEMWDCGCELVAIDPHMQTIQIYET